MGADMMNLIKQAKAAQSPSLSIRAGFVLDFLRVQGAARNALRKRFTNEMRDFTAGMSNPLDSVVRIGASSYTGARSRDEDGVVAMLAHLDDDRIPLPLILAAVADGVGGHANGDLASAITIQALTERVVDRMTDADTASANLDAVSIETLLVEAFGEAHRKVRQMTTGGATSLTAALIVDRAAYIAHVGDSRAYLLAPGSSEPALLTRDHRFVREWEELGIISSREAMTHPQRHILYRARGELDQCEVDITRRDLVDGARLLLCTDGLWETVEPVDISTAVRRTSHPQRACDALVSMALAHGARDNVTMVLVEIPA